VLVHLAGKEVDVRCIHLHQVAGGLGDVVSGLPGGVGPLVGPLHHAGAADEPHDLPLEEELVFICD
jgi:hypothetical protein